MSCLFCLQSSNASRSSINQGTQEQLISNTRSNSIRVLLLGISNSGKTTLLKNIKRINHKYDSEHLNDRRKVIPDIHSAVVEYMQILCQQADILQKDLEHKENTNIDKKHKHYADEILALTPPFALTPDIGFSLQILWRDKGIKETLKKRDRFQIADNVEHFFEKIEEISDPAYLPDFDDYLRFHQKSCGISRSYIDLYGNSFDICNFEFIDVKGQRWERKKWIKFIPETDAVLYVISLADYNLSLFEDNERNCLCEAIEAFRETMIKADFLRDKLLVILFNKFDEFKVKIRSIPITVAFDDFPANEMNANDSADVIRFIAGKLYSVFEENNVQLTAPLQMVRTNAIDKDHVEKIVTDVTVNLVKMKLEETESPDDT